MARRVPIGIDDFGELRRRGLVYVDKSHLIRELIDDAGAMATLLPRPRRFGKSLNLSMLRHFFERSEEDRAPLFQDLSIWQAGAAYREHFQRYPVIDLTFKGVKSETWEQTAELIRSKIDALFDRHRHVADSDRLSELEKRRFRAMLDGAADESLYRRALFDLSGCLHHHHGAPAVILIDEYDEPIYAGHLHGYAEQVLSYFRILLGEGLKGNPHLWKAVLTGVLRVARESIFSGLNNLSVYTLLRPEMSTCFGFTESEVIALLLEQGKGGDLDEIRGAYNGYRFGDAVVYNPWSILNYAASEDRVLRSYWVNTSSNDLVRDMLSRHALSIEPAIETLLQGEPIDRVVDENVALSDIATESSALWSLLVFSGYLRAEPTGEPTRVDGIYRLSIPNREVRAVYATTFQRWMRERLGGGESGVARLKQALFEGDAEALEGELQTFTTQLLSYHDLAVRQRASDEGAPVSPRLHLYPEQVMHAFIIGLLATLEPEYEVRSNRESGSGRPDLMIRPRVPGKPGVVMELKVARPGKKTPAAALREGLRQIAERDYLAELRAAGAAPAHGFAAAFDGKRVWVRAASGEQTGRAKRAPSKKTRAPAGRKKKR